MSSPIIRRLTAVLTLVAALWLAAPPAVDAASRSSSTKTRVILGSTFLDQVVAWVLDFWPAPASADRSRQKTGTGMTGNTETEAASTIESDRGAMIDPNGCPFQQYGCS